MNKVKLQSEILGPTVLFMGSVHGNEPAGTKAIQEVFAEVKDKNLLKKGVIIGLAPTNQKAYKESKRLIDADLNRILKPHKNPRLYEEHLANKVLEEIKNTDVLLDLHTTLAAGPPSVFVDFPTKANEDFAKILDAEFSLFDWPRLYENNKYGFTSYDTTRAAFELGKSGIILECGQHEDTASIEVAKDAIWRTLAYFELIERDFSETKEQTRIFFTQIESKLSDDDHFAKKWKHLEKVTEGEVLAVRENGERLTSPEDGRILFPKHGAQAEGEWYYFGVER